MSTFPCLKGVLCGLLILKYLEIPGDAIEVQGGSRFQEKMYCCVDVGVSCCARTLAGLKKNCIHFKGAFLTYTGRKLPLVILMV